ncbi:MAG: hypothetical protein ACE5JH_04310 [Acidobacteriota bacterium]
MAEKRSVTIPLTARQKQQIRSATGKTISALKVQASSGALKPMLTTRSLRKRTLARKLAGTAQMGIR